MSFPVEKLKIYSQFASEAMGTQIDAAIELLDKKFGEGFSAAHPSIVLQTCQVISSNMKPIFSYFENGGSNYDD